MANKISFRARTRKAGAILTLAIAPSAMATSTAWTGNGTDSNWFNPLNWSSGLPSGNDAYNTTGQLILLNSFSGFVSSFTTNGPFYVQSGGSLVGATPGVSTIEVDNTGFSINGGTLKDLVITATSVAPTFSNGNANYLSGVTSYADLNLSLAGRVRISNGLTLGPSAVMAVSAGSYAAFEGSQTVSGGSIQLGNGFITIEGTSALTAAPGTLIHGFGLVATQIYTGGAITFANQGTVSADSSGSSLTLSAGTLSNSGTFQGTNNGNLLINSSFNNAGGLVTASSGGTVTLNAITISNGQVTTTGTGRITPTNSGSNIITNANVNAVMDLSNGTRLRLDNSVVNAQSSTVNSSGIMGITGNTTISGGTITLGSTGSNYLTVEGASTGTIGTLASVQGKGIIGIPVYLGGASTLINQGLISANVAAGNLTVSPTTLNNSGTMNAISGAALVLTGSGAVNSGSIVASGAGSTLNISTSINNSAGSITASSGGDINLLVGALTGGTVSTTSGGKITANTSGSNFINNASVDATFDLSNGGRIRLDNTSAAVQSSAVNNNAIITAQDQTNITSGTISFGPVGSNYFSVEGGATLTVGTLATLHGSNALIGVAVYLGGSSTVNNAGTISSDVSGGSVTLNPTTINNTGNINAVNGGTVVITSSSSDTNSGAISASGSGSTLNFVSSVNNTGGTISATSNGLIQVLGSTLTGGSVTTSGGAKITGSNNSSNIIQSAAVDATVDLSNGGRLRLINSSVALQSSVVDNGGVLDAQGNTTFTSGTLMLNATVGTQTLGVEGSSTLYNGPGATIHGGKAGIGVPQYVGGSSTFNNQGLVSADVAGTSLNIAPTVFVNTGTAQASGGTLTLSSAVTNTGGVITANTNGTVLINGITVTGGSLTTTGTGKITATNTSVNVISAGSVNGVIDLSNGGRIQLINSTAALQSSVIDNGGVMTTQGISTLTSGTLSFGAAGTQALGVEGGATLFNGPGATVRGGHATIGVQQYIGGTSIFDNQGLVSADVSGASISMGGTSFVNTGTAQAVSGGTLTLSTATNNTGGLITANTSGTILFNSITLTGGSVTTTGTGKITGTNTSTNVISGASVNGVIDLSNGGRLQLINTTAALQSSIINNGGVMSVQGSSTFSSGTMGFGTAGTQAVGIETGGTLTNGAGATIHGGHATVGVPQYFGGPNLLNNAGTISADMAGAALSVLPSNMLNSGTLMAASGGDLVLSGTSATNVGTITSTGSASVITLSTVMNNSGGSVTLADGTLQFASGSITRGTISGTGPIEGTNTNNNLIDSATVNTGLILNGGGRLRLNNSTFSFTGGTVSGASILDTQGSTTFAAGTVTFDASGNQMAAEGGGTFVVAAPATIDGANATFGLPQVVPGVTALVNHGLISDDVALGNFNINYGSVTNDGTLQATSGGTMHLNANVANAGGTINAGSGGTMVFAGISVTGGTLSGSGDLLFTNNSHNVLSGVTTNGDLDLQSGGFAQFTNNLSMNGSAKVDNGGVMAASNTETITAGTVSLGTHGTNQLTIEGTSTLTIGAAATVTGNGVIGNQVILSGATHLVNSGTISANASGSNVTINHAPLLNNGTLSAVANGKVTVTTPMTWGGGSVTGDGAVYANAGVTITGDVTKSGSGALVVNGGFTLSPGSNLNVDKGAIIVNYTGASPVNAIRNALISGYDGSLWDGQGITSHSAANDTNYLTAVAYAEVSDLAVSSFDGQPIPGNAVILKYTYNGDANMDGTVTTDDFFAFVAGFNGQGSGWAYGDFNYDGMITTDDLFIFVSAFNGQGMPLSELQNAILDDGALTVSQRSAMLSVVPEPGTVSMIGAAGAGLMMKRKRRK